MATKKETMKPVPAKVAKPKKDPVALMRSFIEIADSLPSAPELGLMPKEVAACADLAYQVREARLALAHKLAGLQKAETALCEHLINTMPKSAAKGTTGQIATATIVKKSKPQVQDWDKFYAWVKKTGSFEFLQRRLSEGPVLERWESPNKKLQVVPGVGSYTAVSVSLVKAK